MTHSKTKKTRVLVDLKIAANNGYCGIAKENRLVFKMLSQADSVKADGLLISGNQSTVLSRYRKPKAYADSIAQANRFFHEMLQHDPLLWGSLLKNLRVSRFFALMKRQFDLYSIDPLFQDVVWRTVFDKSLGVKDRELLSHSQYYYTDMASLHLAARAYFKQKAHLNTQGYHFALFLEPTAVSVSKGTTKIVRYHDAIPITEPDFSGAMFSQGSINKLNLCAEDSYFVCNSEPTQKALLAIRPELELKTQVIPCAMTSHYKKVNNEETLRQIIVSRFSSLIVKPELLGEVRRKVLSAPTLNYIFNLATFDPKKNHLCLIKAWEKLNYNNPNPIKLVIGANRGWFSKEVQDLMRPHIEMGNILHLENLSVDDLPYLFSHAKAFVFPSFTEGFGLPPLEAMQCECPTIVSDIPAHRWVMGEASLYCDPYNPDSLKEALEKLVTHPDAKTLRAELAQKGLKQVERYSETTLSSQWAALFEKGL